jgi:hypothetical protein
MLYLLQEEDAYQSKLGLDLKIISEGHRFMNFGF